MKDQRPCSMGCKGHITHPCEKCGKQWTVDGEQVATKICTGCKQELPEMAFYRNPRGKPGRRPKCKRCHDCIVNSYRHTEAGKAMKKRANAKYDAKNPKAIECHKLVTMAINKGKLQRPNVCSECGNDEYTEAHHDDYSKPYDVRWLCRQCHKDQHFNK